MRRFTGTFFIIAIIAAIFGYMGIATSAMAMGKILFYIFISLFLVSLIFGRRLDRS